MREIVAPTVAGMAKRGAPFRGVLFAGLMIGADGPKLIEFNVRFGDPEAEAILARLDDDLLEFLLGCAQRRIAGRARRASRDRRRARPWSWRRAAIRAFREGHADPRPRCGGARAGRRRSCTPARAATARRLVADGGRVLAVTALGRDVAEAQARAYAAVDRIDWPGGFCRRDIGWRAIARSRGG